MNNERIQKNALAPSDLTVKIASGDMALDVVRSLHTIIFMPKMA
jgi:hypothetical protein